MTRLRRFALIAACALLALTGGALRAQAPETSEEDATLTMTGVDLYMHRIAPTGGEAETPTFWVHAESGRFIDTGQVWRLESADAIIYRDNAVELTLNARQGEFNQREESARLAGDVAMVSDSLEVAADALVWNNAEGRVTSESPVRVSGAQCAIEADALQLIPESGELELTNARGTLTLAGDEE
jgi:LPS export ABC transporter protein LptC